ncbi:MAG: hypothetical protein KDH96_10380 [Candidatus Riesia sp.]|nr:hypothetical protein [Candidatus Riesia sp.]
MRKLTDFIVESENLNQHDGILVIVDVQDVFDKFIPDGLEEKIASYCKEFDKVYQIWDSNKTNKRTYDFPNQVRIVRKNYGTKFSNDLVKITNKLEQEYPNAQEGDTFRVGNNNFVVRIHNNHNWFYLNDDLVNLYNELKGKKVIVIGGADEECIEDVYISMKSYGIFPIYNHDYIYSAKTSNKQKASLNNQ